MKKGEHFSSKLWYTDSSEQKYSKKSYRCKELFPYFKSLLSIIVLYQQDHLQFAHVVGEKYNLDNQPFLLLLLDKTGKKGQKKEI